MRGYFGIGIEHAKTEANIGTLWRSAKSLGASFIFTIGRRYRSQHTDTANTPKHLPLYHYDSIDLLLSNLPRDCRLIGVELDQKSRSLVTFVHPERSIYLLGAEDKGLSKEAIERCHMLVQIPGNPCLNVSVAGSIVMYDRYMKGSHVS